MKARNLVIFCLLALCFCRLSAQEKLDIEFKHAGKYYDIRSFEVADNGRFLIASLSGVKDSLLVIDFKTKQPVKLKGLYGTMHGYNLINAQNVLLVHTGDLSASTSSQCFVYDTHTFELKKVIQIGKAKADPAATSSYFQPQPTGYERLLAVENGNLITINFKNEILATNIETEKTDSLVTLSLPDQYYLNLYTATYNNGKFSAAITSRDKQVKLLWIDMQNKDHKFTDVPAGFELYRNISSADAAKWYVLKPIADKLKGNLLIGVNLNDGGVIQSIPVEAAAGNFFPDQQGGRFMISAYSDGDIWTKASDGKYTKGAAKVNVGSAGFAFLANANAFVTADNYKLWVYDLDANNEAFNIELSLDNKDGDNFAAIVAGKNQQVYYVLKNEKSFKFRSQQVKLNKIAKVAETIKPISELPAIARKPGTPHLVIQQGHQGKPNSIVFAKSRNWLISGDESGALVFWDRRSMLQIKKVQLNRDGISGPKNSMHIALHPTKEIIAVSWNYNAVLWLDFNGNELARLKTDGQSPLVHFSEDGKYFFYAQSNSKLSVLDLEKGSILSTYDFDTFANILNYAFSGNSDRLALPTATGSVKILNALTGELLDEVKTAHTTRIRLIAFHPTENVVATLGNPLELCFTNLTTKQTNSVLKGGVAGVGDMIWGFLFKKDGEIVISGPMGSKNPDNSPNNLFTAKYDPKTNYSGPFTFYENKKDLSLSLNAVADADEQTIFTLNANNTIEVWDVASKAHVRTIRGNSEIIEDILVTPDFKGLLVGTGSDSKNYLRKLNLETANIAAFDGIKYGTRNFRSNGDGTYQAAFTGKSKKIDLDADKVLEEIEHKFLDECIANTPLGAVFYGDGMLNIIPKGSTKPRLLYKFSGKEDQPVLWQKVNGRNRNYALNEAGTKLYLYDFEKFIVFDLATGKRTASTTGDPLIKQVAGFKIVGDQVIVAIKNELYQYDLLSGKLNLLDNVINGNPVFDDWLYQPVLGRGKAGKMAISYAQDTIMVNGLSNQRLEVFDPAEKNSSITLPAGAEPVKRLEFSNDEQLLYVVYNSEIQIISIGKRELLATLAFVPGGKFIMFTPDNYYFASPKFSDVGFNINDQVYDISQFDVKFNRPDIVLERLGMADRKLIDLYKKAYEKRLGRLNIKEGQLEVSATLPQVKLMNKLSVLTTTNPGLDLDLEITKGSKPLKALFITVNDVPVNGLKGVALDQQNNIALKQMVKLASGTNVVNIYASDVSGAESLRTTISVNYKPAEPVKSRIFFAGVGVSNYRDTTYNLTYADKDIKDLEGIFKDKNAQTSILLNASATQADIAALKQQLMQTTEEDVVILSLSGHGLVNKDGEFFYAGYETDFKKPENTAVSFATLEWLLDGIPARRKLLMIDACHSGELVKDIQIGEGGNQAMSNGVKVATKGIEAEVSADAVSLQNSYDLMKQLFTDLSKSNGAEVISAAGGLEFAFEDAKYKNGVFTYCLKKALLENAADENKDNMVTVGELKAFMIREVSRLTGGRQKPTVRQEAVNNDWKVW